MTPEEIEELRAMVGRLGANAYDKNLAVVLGAALEHIDQQAAQLAEYRRPMESMDTEQLSQWNVELSTLLCMPVSDRENLWWQIAVGDHLEKFAKSWHSSRIKELEVQVAALQEIVGEERAKYNLSWKDCAYRAPDTYCEKTQNYCTLEDCPLLEEQKTEARRQLAEEHPEAFK